MNYKNIGHKIILLMPEIYQSTIVSRRIVHCIDKNLLRSLAFINRYRLIASSLHNGEFYEYNSQ